jgi:hypothetical protein
VAIPYGRLERTGDVVDIVSIYFTLGDVGVGSEVVFEPEATPHSLARGTVQALPLYQCLKSFPINNQQPTSRYLI